VPSISITSKAFALLTTATLPSQPKDSASQNANPGMPACGKAGKWGLARKSGFSNA